MRYGRYGLPYLFLRWGLGITFIWIGIDIFRNPQNWIGFLPNQVPFDIAREGALRAGGFFDVAIGILLIVRFMPKIVGLLASIHLLGIIIMNSLDAVIIRDVGLLGASMAILFWPSRHHRSKFWFPFKKRKKIEYED